MKKRVAIIYPNKFKAGISCLAIHVLAKHLSKYNDLDVKVFFLENYKMIKNYDAIFITLQYEMDYFNAIRIINDLRKTNPKAVFAAGGPCVMENPFPLLNYFDVFIIGEIEKTDIMYNIIYHNFDLDGVFYKGKDKVRRVYPKKLDLEDYPIYQPTSEKGAYGKAFLLEIGRGCPRRCKFCLARVIYYPPRFRKLDDLIYLAEEGIKVNKVEKIALIAPSVGDYKYIVELCNFLNEKGVKISPSSLRADTITEELLKLLDIKTLTIAPEAGSEELRKFINKDISNEDIFNAVELAKKFGIEKVKLYYLIGLPGEKEEDIKAIASLTEKIKREIKRVEVSINPFVPKPHTEFEDFIFDIDSKKKIKLLEKMLKKIRVKVSYENFNSMLCQAVLAKGNESLGKYLDDYHKFLKVIKKDINCYLNPKEKPWKKILIR
ncbi:radical SAM protein [Methanocaldococcus villosus KIN24-T80]|uniref:Radical SAM protein n=1 Tax=Methanocaldococcus villosus KIN24-T80 TaxID=1069083 RepID=N6UVL1_9EURY|nr:radical SAM protein [Methanocaldococcus villosus]ENN96384.1 radical SAM protein [Methanocaldococcus villosus KIN24-T80]